MSFTPSKRVIDPAADIFRPMEGMPQERHGPSPSGSASTLQGTSYESVTLRRAAIHSEN